jgi:DNA-binding transcriptional ArsR family regulator
VTGAVVEWFEAPIPGSSPGTEDQELDTGEVAQDPGGAAVGGNLAAVIASGNSTTPRNMINAEKQRLAKAESVVTRRSCKAMVTSLRPNAAQPTISKHLKVLEQAGLVERTIEGRVHRFRLRQKPLREAERWIARQQAFWTAAVDQLDRLLLEVSRDES